MTRRLIDVLACLVGRSDLSLSETGRVDEESHDTATDETGDGDGHDPGEEQEADSLPVDGFEAAVAETDADGGTGDTHRGGDRKLVLREEQDGDSGTHFHG